MLNVLGYIHHNNDYLYQRLHSASMRDIDFFTWRRECVLRFQQMTCADEVYQELQRQTQALEFDYYALCVRHPVPFTRPRTSVHSSYPQQWMAQYQSENYFAIDPVLKPENFIQGHLPWTDELFTDAQQLWDGAGPRFTQGNNAVSDDAKSCARFPFRVMYQLTGTLDIQ